MAEIVRMVAMNPTVRRIATDVAALVAKEIIRIAKA